MPILPTAAPASPPVPDRADRAAFSGQMYAMFTYLVGAFTTWVQEVGSDVYANAGEATTQTEIATTQAGTATTQAGIATTQAGIATTQAGISITASNNATSLYTSFDQSYLGQKGSPPAVDNTGGALITGAMYFHTAGINPGFRAWDGGGWVEAAGVIHPDFIITREMKTATANQTVFALSNSYTINSNAIMVYQNGVRLMQSDYTETDASTITLAVGATAGDEMFFEVGVAVAGSVQVASNVTFTPTGNVAATTVQAAVAELDAEKANLTANTFTGVQTFGKSLRETKSVVTASDLDLSLGNYFTHTVSGATTLTISNTPAAGTVVSCIIELTNGGSATVNWFAGMKWAGGVAPVLTAAGVDVISFYSHDGGATWRGAMVAKDSK